MPLPIKKKTLAKIKDKIKDSKTSPRSPGGTVIRRAIMSPIALNFPKQKNCCSLSDLSVNDCKYRAWC